MNGFFFQPQDTTWVQGGLNLMAGLCTPEQLKPEHHTLQAAFQPRELGVVTDHAFGKAELIYLTSALGYYHGFASAPGNTVYTADGQDMTVRVQRGVRDLLVRLTTALGVYDETVLEAALAKGRRYAEQYAASAILVQCEVQA